MKLPLLGAPAEATQWALGCTATATALGAYESGEWKAAALALLGQVLAALVAWRAAELAWRASGQGPR
jgi:hypothetical protein